MRLSQGPITGGGKGGVGGGGGGGLGRDNFLKLLAQHHKIRMEGGGEGEGGKMKVCIYKRAGDSAVVRVAAS